jgi:hypothetical protein
MNFTTTLFQIGNNVGIDVPPEVRDALGGGKNPLVVVTLNGFTYPGKIASMAGKLLISVSAEIRQKAGVKGGETHEVTLVLDDKPRVIEPTEDLAAALAADPAAAAAWEKLSPSNRKAHVTAIEGAKAPETRARRVLKALETLRGD